MVELIITFGQCHKHHHNGYTLDKDCVGIIRAPTYEEADALAFEWFDGKFHQHVPREYWDEDSIKYFPLGYIYLN